MKFLKRYINQVLQEIRKVSWPSKQQTINKTVLVIVVGAVVTFYIGGIDLILQRIMQALIR